MKHLGLIGSVNRELPVVYWRVLNDEARLRLGGMHTARFSMHSPDAEELEQVLRREDWTSLTQTFVSLARMLADAGVDGLAICGSALNPIARDVGCETGLQVVSMGHAMSATLKMFRYRRVVIVGTRTELEDQMWVEALNDFHVRVPSEEEGKWLGSLARSGDGDTEGLQNATNQIIHGHRRRGAQAIVLAEPALSQWINLEESLLPVFDAAEIHAWGAAGWLLAGEGKCMLSAPPCVVRED